MPSPVWKGTLSFGMVSVPVRLLTARSRHSVTMHQFEQGTSDRIRHRMVNERTGEEVPRDRITTGAKTSADEEYVLLDSAGLDPIASGRGREMEISAFVPAQVIDPLWYDAAYYLAPETNAAAKPYRLLYRALTDTERLGVASVVLRQREYLSVIGPRKGVLILSTLYWPDEIRDPPEVLPSIPEQRAGERELDLTKQLVNAMSKEWRPEDYADTHHRRLAKLRAEAPLSELPKKELDRIASELDIAGRSRMSRSDLESAIAEARNQRPAPQREMTASGRGPGGKSRGDHRRIPPH